MSKSGQSQARNKKQTQSPVQSQAKMLNISSVRNCTSVKNAFIYTMQHCAYAKKVDSGILALGKKKKGKLGPIMEKKILPVVEDANKLVNYVCGSNIFKEGEDIKIKPDSEYPEWLWSIRTGPPPPLSEMDPNTLEYWRRVRKIGHRKTNVLLKLRRF